MLSFASHFLSISAARNHVFTKSMTDFLIPYEAKLVTRNPEVVLLLLLRLLAILSLRMEVKTVVLKVVMHCEGCASSVKRAVARIPGVTSYTIDFPAQKVTVIGNVKPDEVLRRVAKTGKHATFWPQEPPVPKEEEQKKEKQENESDAKAADDDTNKEGKNEEKPKEVEEKKEEDSAEKPKSEDAVAAKEVTKEGADDVAKKTEVNNNEEEKNPDKNNEEKVEDEKKDEQQQQQQEEEKKPEAPKQEDPHPKVIVVGNVTREEVFKRVSRTGKQTAFWPEEPKEEKEEKKEEKEEETKEKTKEEPEKEESKDEKKEEAAAAKEENKDKATTQVEERKEPFLVFEELYPVSFALRPDYTRYYYY
ncbi:unnamed protein product [Sphagnum tenellum]